LSGHTVSTAQSKGWDTLSNGALLNAAEAAGFELRLTTNRRIRHQQNLQARRVAIVVLTGTTWHANADTTRNLCERAG
jgi:hypothetical protein